MTKGRKLENPTYPNFRDRVSGVQNLWPPRSPCCNRSIITIRFGIIFNTWRIDDSYVNKLKMRFEKPLPGFNLILVYRWGRGGPEVGLYPQSTPN